MEKVETESERRSVADTESGRRVEAEINDSPIEQVRLTVPITDDPTIPVLTIRAWVLGVFFCLVQASATGIGVFRQNPIFIPVFIWQLGVLPVGKYLARVLPARRFTFPGTNFKFSFNPGPFSIKEHCLIALMIEAGYIAPQLTTYMVIMKVFYGLKVNTTVAQIMNTGVQMLGMGIAGIFMKLVVDNPRMWWPSTLINVVTYRTLHKPEKRKKGSITRLQYLVISCLAIFVYGMIPGYLFPAGVAISVLCLIWKNSIFAQQLGSARHGFGIGSFTLSLETLNLSPIDPFVMPLFSINNLMFGFITFMYIFCPIYYFKNVNYAKRFALSSEFVYDMYGQQYDDTRAMNEDFTFSQEKYDKYSKVYFNTFQVGSYWYTLSCLTAGLAHVFIHHGREMYLAVLEVYGYQMKTDVHGRLMRKYKRVPSTWYFLLIAASLISTVVTSHIGINEYMRLPPLYVLCATMLSVCLTVPDMVLVASTGQGIPTGIMTEMVLGYLNKGQSFPNMLLRNFFSEVPSHIIMYCMMLKFAHYMKLPPRDVYIARFSTSIMASVVNMAAAWKVVNSIPNICLPEKLPPGSPWTCPLVRMHASNSTVWGLIGPKEVFFPHGVYRSVIWAFPMGVTFVILHWVLTLKFPRSKLLANIYVPTILSGAANTPPAGPINWWTSYVLGVINNGYIYKYHKRLWSKYNYLTASAVSIGTGLVAFFIFLTVQRYELYGPDWWGLTNFEHCPLAKCPTDPNVDGGPLCKAAQP